MRGVLGALALSALLGACARLPDVQYTYYLAKASVAVTVTQSLSCSADGQTMAVATTGSATPTYTADYSDSHVVKIKDVEGTFGSFADSSMGFQFYPDGRLKGVNQQTVGQGEAIIKAAVTLAATLAIGGGGPEKEKAPPATAECAAIKNFAGDKGVATILYTATLKTPEDFAAPRLVVEPQSVPLKTALEGKRLPGLKLVARTSVKDDARVRPVSNSDMGDAVLLTLQKTSTIELELLAENAPAWTQLVTIPQSKPNNTYTLPIPRAALFGTQSFAIALSEGGGVDSVSYGKLTGVAGALNSANAVAGAGTTADSARANELKAKADVIVQTNRLAKCRAQPSSCQ